MCIPRGASAPRGVFGSGHTALAPRRCRDDVCNPHSVHCRFDASPDQVKPWLRLFGAAADEHVPADPAEAWLTRVRRMAGRARVELQGSEPAGNTADPAVSRSRR